MYLLCNQWCNQSNFWSCNYIRCCSKQNRFSNWINCSSIRKYYIIFINIKRCRYSRRIFKLYSSSNFTTSCCYIIINSKPNTKYCIEPTIIGQSRPLIRSGKRKCQAHSKSYKYAIYPFTPEYMPRQDLGFIFAYLPK